MSHGMGISFGKPNPSRTGKPPLYIRHGQGGMSLLDISIVILTLFPLIAVPFIGARAYKQGSDRSCSILNIRNVEQAIRHFQNTNQLSIGDNFAASSIYKDDSSTYLLTPLCPANGKYTLSATIPDYSTPALTCSLADDPALLAPKNTAGW